MSERGVFAVDRGIFADERFADEPFTEREAFLWLVAEAAWKARRVRSGAAVVELARGQLCHSVRFMAEAWRWSKSRVDRFLSKLERWGTIARSSGTATSVISVCGYDEIQRVTLPERDSDAAEAGQQRDRGSRNSGTSAPSVTRCEDEEILGEYPSQRDSNGTDASLDAGQQRDKREGIKKQISLSSDDEGGAIDQAAQDTSKRPAKRVDQHLEKFEEFRRIYPAKHVSFPTTQARKRWIETMKRGENPDDVLAGAKAYAAEQTQVGNVGTKFVKGAEAWLHQQLWKDFLGRLPQGGASAGAAANGNSAVPDDYLSRLSDEDWRKHVSRWRATGGEWILAQRTPPPDDRRTRVPLAILAEFGIRHSQDGRAAPSLTGTG